MGLKYSKKIAYGMGDFGISISYFAVGFFFIYYLTDIIGMSAYLAGIAFFIGKLWDSINDPIIGVWSDRIKSKFGRKRVFLLFGAVPFGLSFALLWFIPSLANEGLQFVIATLLILLYATAYSVVTVPYMALVPVMSKDYDERTQITSIRAVLSTFGSILGGGLALLISDGTDAVVTLRMMTVILGVITIFTTLIAAWSVKKIDTPENNIPISPLKFKSYFKLLAKRNVLILMIVKVLGAIGTGALTVSMVYFTENIVGSTSSSTYALAIYVVATAIGIPIWNKMTKKHDKRRLLLISNIVSAIILLAIAFGVSESVTIPFYVGCLLLGFSMAGWLLIPYSLVPDLVEYYNVKFNERHESTFFGYWMTSHQLGIALSGLFIGVILSVTGYVGDLAIQPSSALMGIRIVFGVVPAVFIVLSAIVLQRYTISRDKYNEFSQTVKTLK
ncbi:MAG: MFS transporter [Candidatus Kerfeldbacteria bacterium]